MFPTVQPELKREGLALVLSLALVLAAVLVWAAASPAGADEGTGPPVKPTGLSVSTEPGSLDAGVSWNDVEGADFYWVRWRVYARGEKLNDGVKVESSATTITVAGYGEWVARVQACNDAGCGKPLAKRFEVEPIPEPTPPPIPTATPTPTTEPTATPTTEPTPEPTPEQANRAPEIDENAARYDSFVETGNAPR
ncbi:MAG: hypothetical protein OXK79_12770, partial [Chloroflexota bacterium]|nr:hypothetical protein [Chloroflexota bacterium]